MPRGQLPERHRCNNLLELRGGHTAAQHRCQRLFGVQRGVVQRSCRSDRVRGVLAGRLRCGRRGDSVRGLPDRDVLGLHAGNDVGELFGLCGGQLPKRHRCSQLHELSIVDLLDRRGRHSLDNLC